MDNLTIILLLVVFGFVLIILLFKFVEFLTAFLWDIKYINSEIARCTGSEKNYWRIEKKKLFLSLLPFYKNKK